MVSFQSTANTTRTENDPLLQIPPMQRVTADGDFPIPGSGDERVSVNVFVAIGFSKPLAVSSINVQTLQLTGPQGQVGATVIPAEPGHARVS